LLAIEKVAAARRQILARRATAGSGDVIQADVDLAAQTLVAARERPYPQAIVAVTGGSLSTVTPLFDDWFFRFAYRDLDQQSVASLEVPARIALQVQHLVAQLQAAVREQVHGVPDPTQALIAAAQLGEQLGRKEQLSAVAAERARLRNSIESMTYRIAGLEAQLAVRVAAQLSEQAEFVRVIDQLQATFEGIRQQLGRSAPDAPSAIKRLIEQVRRLRADLGRPPGSRGRAPARHVAAKAVKSLRAKTPRGLRSAGRKRPAAHPRARRTSRSR
jgi:phage shock protein A